MTPTHHNSNSFAGLMIILTKPYRVGEYAERFQDGRIAIPFPQREVRLVSES
jgi:hypothetical protein